jgi:hypothetical protein
MDTHKTDAELSVLSSGDEVCHRMPEKVDEYHPQLPRVQRRQEFAIPETSERDQSLP